MVLRLLSLAILVVAAPLAAQDTLPARKRVPLTAPTMKKPQGPAGWLGFRHSAERDSLVVLEVAPGSPADRAGLRAGDRIIAIGDRIATRELLLDNPPMVGDTRRLTVRRDAETLTLEVVAVAPPPGTLKPTRVMVAKADTIAREARALRGEMAQKATRAVVAPSRVDTVELRPTPAQRKLRRDTTDRVTLKLLETYGDSLAPRMLVDKSTYTDLLLTLEKTKRDTLRGSVRKLLADSTLYVELNGMIKDMDVLLTKVTARTNALAGAELEHLNPGLADYFGGVAEGVFVLRVAPGTPAATAGLQPGDIVETLNGERVETIGTLRAAIAESSGPLTLHVIRKGRPATVVLRKE